ncbi:hypothetical protein K458DRAFT_192032 [Lentithecium fluviatile CBS 122367]|uniref:Uncharacterized protein n=1 Tax=Lentithecium fluviatile CBS 122367 TaxID=1168545 RepID=A0A6G1JBQ0_9PLEO|nr:hypothetical protein K458DRAFT_192032 [Lentithecium fluviatile CBS 122367]
MAPKPLVYLLAITAAGIASVSAVALPEPKPFTIPADVEILDLRTEEDKASGGIDKRTNGAVYVCKAIDFDANQGCKLLYTSFNAPTNLVNTEYNNVISSAGADAGTVCQFYDGFYNNDCGGQGSLYIDNPGKSDFRQYSWNNGAGTWNDIVSCIKCTW